MIHKRIRKSEEIENLPEGTSFYYCDRPDLIHRTEFCVLEFRQPDSASKPEPTPQVRKPLPDPPYPPQVYTPNAYVFDAEALDEYKKFLKAHSKFLRPLITRYKVNLSEPRWAIVYFISGESRHYFYWAVKNLMSDVHFNLIERALNLVFNFQTYSKNLKKSTLVAYSGVKGLHEFFNEFEAIIFEREVSNVISKFAANQRQLLKSTQLSDNDKRALLLINRIPQDVAKNFIKKMTPCKSIPTIIDELRFLASNSIVWDKEWVKKFIEKNKLNAEIVFEDANILLLKVKDFNSIRRLGGNTSWCITRKHSFWGNYYLDTPSIAEQYVLFNFALPEYDDASIVGFTETIGRGITAMHNFNNTSLLDRNRELEHQYNKYVNDFKDKILFEVTDENKEGLNELTKNSRNSPEDFLESVGIDCKQYKKEPFFKWDRDSVLETINSIDNGNHIILYDKGNILTIMVNDVPAMSVIGSRIESFDRLYFGCQRIFRLDFNKKREDPESIVCVSLNDRSLPVMNSINEVSATTLKSLLNECGGDAFALCKSDTALEKYLLCISKNDFDEAREVMCSKEFAKEYALAPKYVSEKVFQMWDSTRFVFTSATLLLTRIPFEHLLRAGIPPSKFLNEYDAWRFLKQFQKMFEVGRGICSNNKEMLEFEISVLEKIMGVTESSGTLQERVYKAIDSVAETMSKSYTDRSACGYCAR